MHVTIFKGTYNFCYRYLSYISHKESHMCILLLFYTGCHSRRRARPAPKIIPCAGPVSQPIENDLVITDLEEPGEESVHADAMPVIYQMLPGFLATQVAMEAYATKIAMEAPEVAMEAPEAQVEKNTESGVAHIEAKPLKMKLHGHMEEPQKEVIYQYTNMKHPVENDIVIEDLEFVDDLEDTKVHTVSMLPGLLVSNLDQ